MLEMYKRLLATWEAHPNKLQKLLLATIKADLSARIAVKRPRVDDEQGEAFDIVDVDDFARELEEGLERQKTTDALPRRRRPQQADVEQQNSDVEDGISAVSGQKQIPLCPLSEVHGSGNNTDVDEDGDDDDIDEDDASDGVGDDDGDDDDIDDL